MIEAFKLLGRIVLDGGQTVIKELTGIGDKADSTGDNMQNMGQQTSTAGTQAAKAINEAGQSARNTSGAMGTTSQAAATMGQAVNNAGKVAQQSLGQLPKELRSMARGLGEMDTATRAAFNTVGQMYTEQRTKMQGFNRDQIQNKVGWIALAAEAKNYQGTTAQFMSQVVELGAKEKAVNDARMKANEIGKMGILQQVGAMANLSTQASKIGKIYDGMNNPMMKVNQAGLAIADGLNKMALMGTAAAIALKQLGPSANMKDLQDRIGVINQGIMRMGMVALGAAVALVGFTKLMANAAMGPDPAKTRQAMADIKAEYDQALSDRTQELYNWASIFENVEIKVPSSKMLLDALEEQVTVFKQWRTNLKTLTQRGVDEDFIAELQKMGPKAAGEIQAMTNMTGPELDKYVSLWREKHFQAYSQSESELAKLKQATDQKVKELQNSLEPLGLSVEKFKSVWAEALGPFVDLWGEIAAKVVDTGTKVGEFFVKLNEKAPWVTKIAGMFAYLVSVLALLLSPLAAGIGLFGGLAAAWGALWPLIGPIVTGIGAMSGTIVLVAAGIVALVAVIAIIVKALINWNKETGVLTDAWNQGLAMIKSNADKFIQPLKDIFNDVMSRIKEVVGGMLAEATAFWQEHGTTVMTAVQNFSKMLLAVWNFFMPAIKFLVEGIIGGIISIFKGFFDIVMGLVKIFSGLFSGDWGLLWEGIKQVIWGVIEVIWGWINLSMFGRIIKGAATFFKAIGGAFKAGWTAIKTGVMGFVNSVKAYFTNMKNDFVTIFTTMKTNGLSIWNSLKSALSFIIDSIKQRIVQWLLKIVQDIKIKFTAIKTTTTTIWNGIKSFFTTIFNFFKTIFTNAFNAYVNICQKVFLAIQKVITTVWNFIKNLFVNSFNNWKTLFTNTFNFLKTKTETAFNAIKKVLTTVWTAIKTFFVNGFNNWKTLFTNTFNAIKNTVTTIFNTVKNFISTTWNTIKNNVTTAVTTLKNNAVNAFNNVKTKATQIFNNVRDAITGPIKTAMDKVNGYIEKIKGWFNKLKLTIPKPKVPKIVLKTSTKTILKKTFTYPTGFDVQWAAKGGILDRATMVGAGEAGKELLMPLEGKYFKPVATMIADQIKGMGGGLAMAGGARIEIPIILNGREIARSIVPSLDKEIERQRVIRRRGI